MQAFTNYFLLQKANPTAGGANSSRSTSTASTSTSTDSSSSSRTRCKFNKFFLIGWLEAVLFFCPYVLQWFVGEPFSLYIPQVRRLL